MITIKPFAAHLAALAVAALTLAHAPAQAHRPYGHGGWVVRPHVGVIVSDVPRFAAAVTIAGIAYLVANDVYYRRREVGGYEVVAPPMQAAPRAVAEPAPRVYVYPRMNQSAEQQATDEYECHRWAVTQTGFDPSGAALGQADAGDMARRGDYLRAQSACLDGRGYTVR
jgi:hypothetical protein